jgi:hypothetical protein
MRFSRTASARFGSARAMVGTIALTNLQHRLLGHLQDVRGSVIHSDIPDRSPD